MKTIEEAIFTSGIFSDNETDFANGFEKGVEFAQRWIPVEEDLPGIGVNVLIKSKEWIDEDYNPNGVRFGFMDDIAWTSVRWCNQIEEFVTITTDSDDEELNIFQTPTHWRPIELK